MQAAANLERNQVILWSRDVMAGQNRCLIVAGSTTASGQARDDGQIIIVTLSGEQIFSSAVAAIIADSKPFCELIAGKELIVAGIPDSLLQIFPASSGVTVYSISEQYMRFVQGSDTKLACNVSAEHLASWTRETISSMAGSSLKLDQADTGTGKWTSAHFKPNPSVLEKFKSMLKGAD